MDLSNYESMLAFVSEEHYDLTAQNKLYRSNFIYLPPPEKNRTVTISYLISSVQYTVLENEHLPCISRSPKDSLFKCVQNAFEFRQKCLLPWSQNNTKLCHTTEDLRAFKEYYAKVYTAFTEKDLYDLTGCFYKCTYLVRNNLRMHVSAKKNMKVVYLLL